MKLHSFVIHLVSKPFIFLENNVIQLTIILLAVYRSYFLCSRQLSCLSFFTVWNLNAKCV